MDTVTLVKDEHQLICSCDKMDQFLNAGWVLKDEPESETKSDTPQEETQTEKILKAPNIHQAIFDEMSREQLYEYAKKIGIFVKRRASKEELIELILKEKEKQKHGLQQ